jgi:signal transduction histidine kinase
VPVIVVVGANLGDRDEALHRLLLLLALGIPAAVLLASAVGWFVAGGALRPVERLRRDAAAASVTGSGATIAVPPTGDELAALARTLNDLLRRQREALDAEHRFIDEASHDLRTPLAVLKAELDLALARPRTRDELAETVAAAARETDQLVRLAEDLLVLARARRGSIAVHRERVDLVEFCRDCAEPFQLGGCRVTLEAERATVVVDPLRLRQAVRNLLDNAFRHGGGREVQLAGRRRPGGQLAITVSDGGPGFPEQFDGRLAVDRSPSRGLGLAIVTAIAEAHGGWVEADRSGPGARMTVIVPEPG